MSIGPPRTTASSVLAAAASAGRDRFEGGTLPRSSSDPRLMLRLLSLLLPSACADGGCGNCGVVRGVSEPSEAEEPGVCASGVPSICCTFMPPLLAAR